MNFEGHSTDKSEYKFTEITSITGVKPYVLRFWETEFSEICPKLNSSGDKLYSNSDLEKIKRIKVLLFSDKLSIPEAKLILQRELEKQSANLHEQNMINKISVDEPQKISPNHVATQLSSLDMMKAALGQDLTEHQKVIYKKHINDDEVLKLVQAKKKLTSVLQRVNQIIETNQWSL